MQNKIEKSDEWKTQTYTLGTLVGMAFGFISAYLFARAVEEDENGRPKKVKTLRLMSVSLAALTLMRQIAELGKGAEKEK